MLYAMILMPFDMLMLYLMPITPCLYFAAFAFAAMRFAAVAA